MSRRKGHKHHNKKCQEEFCSKLDGCGCEFWLAVRRNNVRKSFLAIVILLFVAGLTVAQQSSMSDEGGRVMALENAWNRGLEAKDTKALDMLLAKYVCIHRHRRKHFL